MSSDSYEYELIPMSPIRRIEKRLEKIEEGSSGGSRGIMRDVIDIVRMNQQLVDELAKSNDALRIELSKLPGKLEELIMEIREVVSFIKTSGDEESSGLAKDAMKPVVDKLSELIEQNKKMTEKNETLLHLLDEVKRRSRGPTLGPRPVGGAPKPTQLLPRSQPPMKRAPMKI